MGKRKRALSPKESASEQHNTLSSTNIMKIKCTGDIKKPDVNTQENGSLEKMESQDRVTVTFSSLDTEVNSDDRPTPQLRISARVQNKQRREESIKVDAQQNRQKREESGKLDGHSAIASLKKIDASSQDEDEEDEKSKDSGVMKKKRRIPHNGDAKKRRRPWELWSMEDKNYFFEAINECGKDFEAIQNFLQTKMRKKGVSSCIIKNRDQVRYFYYRTLHKISKFITLSEDVKKSTLELYTLINYGELRRKVGGTLNEKKALKLQELIQNGSASVRVRGKSIRVRTPVCRGLKKLNEFPDDRELGARVPVTISIDIVPANVSSWNYVQSLAHNPRVRISCSMHKTVASIITHLQNKWRHTKQKICDSLISSATFPVQLPSITPKYIRLRPHNITSFNVVNIKPESQVKSCVISLSSHVQLLKRTREADLQRKRGESSKGKDCRPAKKKKISFSKEKITEDGEAKEELKDENLTKKDDDDPTEEVSQEEPDEGSDIEIEEQEVPSTGMAADSPHIDEGHTSSGQDDVVMIESFTPASKKELIGKQPLTSDESGASGFVFEMKEEPSFHLSPSYEEEVMSAVKNIKEEFTDSMETIHQLIALENVATSQEIEEDADVICIGESTRLSAQVRRKQKDSETQNTNESMTANSASQKQDELTSSKTPPPVESQNGEPMTGPLVLERSGYVNNRIIDRVKQGWTLKSCGIITVGELYLMFGENKPITLEYDFEEFEDLEKPTPSAGTLSECTNEEKQEHNRGTENDPKVAETPRGQDSPKDRPLPEGAMLAPVPPSPLPTDGSISQPSSQKGEPPPSSALISPLAKSSSSPDEERANSPNLSEDASGGPDLAKQNKVAAEHVSGMMAKLLYLIRLLSTPKGTEAGMPCICGGNPPVTKSAINPYRSPSGGRGCFNDSFRSPGPSKSPRGCSVSIRSPRTPTLASAGHLMSPGDCAHPSPRSEKTKPASAKRLNIEPNERSSGSSSIHIGGLDADATPLGKDKGQAQDSQGDKPNPGAKKTSDANPDPSGGEFRLPVRPAPRNHACQSPNPSFNAQLSKLLRRYSRPTRRSVRKNMVVQRQLPLLPWIPKEPQGFVALNINNLQQFNIGTAPQITIPIHNPTTETLASSDPQSTITSVVVPQPVTMPLVPETFSKDLKTDNQSSDLNAISVNVSGQQLLTVRMPTCPVSTTAVNSTLSSTSVPITMITTMPISSNCVTTTTVTLTTTTTTCALPLSTNPPITPEIPLKQSAPDTHLAVAESAGYSLGNILSQTIGDIPYLTTPPSTPGGPGNHLDSLLNTSSSIAAKADFDTFISTSNSSNLLSMEELEMASFSSPLKTSAQGPLEPPTTFRESSLLSTPTHLNPSVPTNRLVGANISPIKLNLSALLGSSAVSQSPEKSLDALLQHQATSPLPATAVTTETIGQQTVASPAATTTTQAPVVNAPIQPNVEEEPIIPQIHIPEECSDGLPLLDISMGGTISVQQREGPTIVVSNVVGALHETQPPQSTSATTCTGILSNFSEVSNSGEISLAVTCVTTSANSSSVTGVSETTSLSCGRVNVLEDSLINSFQESNDKMLDITLANSNSNSSFSGLLAAAAAHQPSLDVLMMENSLLQTPPRPMLSSTSGANGAIGVKSNLSLDGESFEGLSGTVPLSPPSSPSRLLRQAETHWMINSESNEFSLSNLLGSMEASPHKGGLIPPPSPAPPSSVRSCQATRTPLLDSSQDKMKVLISTLNDNSVDFTATFARLKKQTKDKSD